MKHFTWKLAVAMAATMGLSAGSALASPINQGPPVGAILNLDGTAIPSSYQHYSVNFIASSANTNLTFAFRDDPSFIYLSDVSLIDTTTASANLLSNGDFSAGPVNSSAPTDWTYVNSYGATFGGYVSSGCGRTVSNCYYDGAVQAYDAITQAVGTNIGDSYSVDFWMHEGSDNANFSQLSTNGDVTGTGGNGINLLVYAQDGIPVLPESAPVPEPGMLAIFGLGLGALGLAARRRKKA